MLEELQQLIREIADSFGSFEIPEDTMAAFTMALPLFQVLQAFNQFGLQEDQLALQGEELDFRREYELPFRAYEYDIQTQLAELGLQTQQERFAIEQLINQDKRAQAQEILQRTREEGAYRAMEQRAGQMSSLMNLAAQREQLAALQGQPRQFTPIRF